MVSYKSKERVIVLDNLNEVNNIWVDRDFLQLNEYIGSSSKMVVENEEIQAETRGKAGILDISSKRVVENEEIQAEIRGKKPKAGILDSCIAENVEIQADIRGKKSKFVTLNLSLALPSTSSSSIQQSLEPSNSNPFRDNSSKRVAENKEIQADIRGKSVIMDRRVSENEEIQAEIREEAVILDLSSKRVAENEEIRAEIRGKKPKFGTLDLSLALPSSSSSLQSLEPSNNNTRIGYFRNGSLSSCYSHPFSHNLSYSLTLSSKEDSEYSREGLNWSVFSRCRPVEEGILTLSSNSHGSLALGCRLQVSSSDSNPFVRLELPVRPTDDSRVSGSMDGGRALQLSRRERILGEIVSESIPLMARIVQELPDETIKSIKVYLRSIIAAPEKKDFLVSLQNRVNGRSDLTIETLSECNKTQLEIFVAIKMGHISFLSLENHLQATELIEIFSLERCRNIRCKSVLPIDDCKCKICSRNKGFCSECMCQVCLNLDYANGTCSWVGCDLCVHWCHGVCAIQRNLIKPGPSINGPSGTTEMQFHCLGCGHSNDMFGFVRDVYMHCAKDWDEETLIEELDYVRKIFDQSEDFKGKELHAITYGLRNKLEKKMISPSDACDFIFQFFKYTDGLSQLLSSSFPASISLAA